MGDNRHALIVGAGIAGLTCSLALAQRGWRVTLVEKADRLSEIGAGIQLAPNAVGVLEDLGLGDALARAASTPAHLDIRGGVMGRLNVSVDTGAFERRYRRRYRVIHRADLQSVLLLAAGRNDAIDLRTGATVTEILERDDHLLVRVATKDGSAVEAATVLIGADGVWSEIRQRVAPGNEAVPSGHTAWRAMVPHDVAADHVNAERVTLWLGPRAHLVHYPVAQGTAVNVVALIKEGWQFEGWSTPGDGNGLRSRFADWPGPAFGLIDAAYSWRKFSVYAVDHAKPWTNGRIALIGDAAHATLPFLAQGAAMAIEDAATIAHHVSGDARIPAALAAYAEERRARVARLIAATRRTGTIYELAGGLAAARDLALTVGGTALVLGRHDWIYRWRPPEARPN